MGKSKRSENRPWKMETKALVHHLTTLFSRQPKKIGTLKRRMTNE
ncbi:hypothetical protein [Alkalicoccus halolimnae]|uniref:Uncharacterized protein n=1 Tax=Alkalicoccus halolimnae TaxID=1667239 RepID=A0AAJ8N0U9_9BACI|nr:hypothetical protein [Alkalicoccus halolimnae]